MDPINNAPPQLGPAVPFSDLQNRLFIGENWFLVKSVSTVDARDLRLVSVGVKSREKPKETSYNTRTVLLATGSRTLFAPIPETTVE